MFLHTQFYVKLESRMGNVSSRKVLEFGVFLRKHFKTNTPVKIIINIYNFSLVHVFILGRRELRDRACYAYGMSDSSMEQWRHNSNA